MMNKTYIIVLAIIIIVTLALLQCGMYEALRDNKLQLSPVDLSVYTRSLPVHGLVDPACSRTKNVYVCAGICPWPNTQNNERISCSFLPRKSNPDFVAHNVYCTPDPDQCPSYNAWLKDDLPQTRQHIQRIPDKLLSNFTLNYSIPVDSSNQQFRTSDTWPANWTVEFIEKYRKQVRARESY
ncbi:unnamed protein product, partial [Rotaria magnacalcarata]